MIIMQNENLNEFPFSFDRTTYRRIIADKEIVVHCHHYNARLQIIIEGASQIDGKGILLSTTEEIFSDYLVNIFSAADDERKKWDKAIRLYSHLGFGVLDISDLENGVITAPLSHFVEGWKVGFKDANNTVCTFTEGYLQAAIYAINGKPATVREQDCLICGAVACRFVIDENRDTPLLKHQKREIVFTTRSNTGYIKSATVNEQQIIDAIVDMPFYGNENGLIPAFNVYLANMPAEFYSLLCHSLIKAMAKVNMKATARNLLIYAGEICALNTLRGIKASTEWTQLIQPMIEQESDSLHGLIAVTNALGWGNWHVKAHDPGESLEMESLNGYEALGYLSYEDYSDESHCYMLTGVAAGIMALLYRDGTIDERIGSFDPCEAACISSRHDCCHFIVEAL